MSKDKKEPQYTDEGLLIEDENLDTNKKPEDENLDTNKNPASSTAVTDKDGNPVALDNQDNVPLGDAQPNVNANDAAQKANNGNPDVSPEIPADATTANPIRTEVPAEDVGEDPMNAPDPKKRYLGQVVISDTTRVVGNQEFHNVRIADGSTYDLDDATYVAQVKVSYDPAYDPTNL